jgi:rubredoxin
METKEPYHDWGCPVCQWIYHEAEGWPEAGIPPGTRWDSVSPNFLCPTCGYTKLGFEEVGG